MRLSLRSVFGLTLSALLLLPGCPGNNPVPADGGRDAGRDGSLADVPLSDVPLSDVPGLDTGMGDGGTEDAGMDDGGMSDGGMSDAPTCGNGAIDAGEDCDGANFGGATCASEGFSSGTIACALDCTFDTSGCVLFMCGNGTIEGTETCEGTDFGGATCVTRGFTGGSLACTDCAIVDTGCTRCGNNTREGAEVCDGTDIGTRTCVAEGFLSGTLGCAAGCGAYDTSACSMGAVPTAGQVVITEIMPDPATVSDMTGEWFELQNTSAGPVELRGCVFVDNVTPTPNTFTVDSNVLIPAGGIVTFARSATPGFTPTFVYAGTWALANADDEIRFSCGGTLIDSVLYSTPGAWGFASGRSTSLAPGSTNATANDTATNWCRGAGTYEATGPNLGTPGAANPVCAVTPTENCTNTTDDDGDGLVDCLDVVDCASAPTCMTGPAPALLFSEYVEGSVGTNKAVEIRNAGTMAVDLAAASCMVRIYSNGSMTGSMIALTGTIAAGDVYTVCVNATTIPMASCDQVAGGLTFNGDDAIAIQCGGALIDVIGQIGTDPGSAWGTPPTSTVDTTLRRRCAVTAGDPIGTDAFDPSAQWLGLADGTIDGLGLPACAP
jgi:hypothetical protein